MSWRQVRHATRRVRRRRKSRWLGLRQAQTRQESRVEALPSRRQPQTRNRWRSVCAPIAYPHDENRTHIRTLTAPSLRTRFACEINEASENVVPDQWSLALISCYIYWCFRHGPRGVTEPPANVFAAIPASAGKRRSPHQFRTRNDRNETQQTRSNVLNRRENQHRRSLAGRS
jgi:hypothetical protein